MTAYKVVRRTEQMQPSGAISVAVDVVEASSGEARMLPGIAGLTLLEATELEVGVVFTLEFKRVVPTP
jgi:hypothetical protein